MNAVQELTGGSPTANILEGGVDQNYLRTDVGGSWNYLSDALGSTLALADAAGVVQTEYTYGPFGTTTASGLSLSNTAQYTGRENDATGLYYYRARYYNPEFGRFLSEDPIGFRGGINKYAYVGNSPLNYTDPLGQSPMGFGWDLMTADGPFDALYKLLNPDGGEGGGNNGNSGGGTSGRKDRPCTGSSNSHLAYTATGILVPGLGLGPSLSATYIPSTRELFIAPGIGAAAGHTFSFGPVIGPNASAVMPGWSLGMGENSTPLTGWQGVGNSNGALVGPSFGLPGASGTLTYGFCFAL